MNKYRHEQKFLCSEEQLRLIENRLKYIMKKDSHTDDLGKYLIRSIYFDDIYRTCFYENENGIDPRQKFRIRTYNFSSDRIFLEKKYKNRGMTGKESCEIDYDIYMKMIKGEDLKDHLGENKLLDELILLRNNRLFKPKIMVEYIRTPYIYTLGNVRVTFDRSIAASNDLKMFDEQIKKISVLANNKHILEVKYDDYLPDAIRNLVNNGHLIQTTFSKYYICCKSMEGRM